MNTKQKIALFIAVIATCAIIFIDQKNQTELKMKKDAEKRHYLEEQKKIEAKRAEQQDIVDRQPLANLSEKPASETNVELKTPDTIPDNGMAKEEAENIEEIVVQTPQYEAVFTNKGAALKKYTLLKFYRTTENKDNLVLLDEIANDKLSMVLNRINETRGLKDFRYRIIRRPDDAVSDGMRQLVMQAVINGWKITKTYTFASEYQEEGKEADKNLQFGFTLDVLVQNMTDETKPFDWDMTALSGFIPDDTDSRYGTCQVLIASEGAKDNSDDIETTSFSDIGKKQAEIVEEKSNEIPLQDKRSNIDWVGMRGRFFATMLNIQENNYSKEVRGYHLSLNPADSLYADRQKDNDLYDFLLAQPHSAYLDWYSRDKSAITIPALASKEIKFSFYGGPVDEEYLAFNPEYNNLVSYSFVGFFEPISKILIKLLKFISSYIPNYGFAIIIMTLLIKTALHGLTRKALASGHEMQKLQPVLKELKLKYKDNPKKMQEETMKLWRENGVSPMGSCFPMIIQIPIFISLFGVFARTFSVRHALFIPGWIEDLSQPDRLFGFGLSIPIIGEYFNLLPILYVALQMIQQSMTPKSSDPQMAQQQKMMKFMPLFFMFIFYTMPSGLVLYFTVSAGYTLVEHWFIRQKLDFNTNDNQVAAAPLAGAGVGFKKKTKK